MSFRDTLQSRFRTEWINSQRLNPLYSAMVEALDVADSMRRQREALAQSGRFSEAGLIEETRKMAAREGVPPLKSLRERLDGWVEATNSKRARIALPKPDPDDLVGAMIRQEMRAHMRTLKQGDLAQLLLKDADLVTLQAVFEVPDYLSGIQKDLRDKVERTQLEARHPQLLAEVEEQEECCSLVEQAIKHGVTTIRTVTRFDNAPPIRFDAWMAEASGEQIPQRHAA